MSYVYDPIYRLIFTESRYNGLIVRARSCSLGYFFEMQNDPIERNPNDMGEAEAKWFCGRFAPYLVEWNMTDREGKPIPATMEGLQSLDIRMIKDISVAWMLAIAGVDFPLEKPSSDGMQERQQQTQETQEETLLDQLNLPMETLQENPLSLVNPS